MEILPEQRSDDGPERGLSRRSVLERSAASVGIALTGSFTELFGSEALAPDSVRERPAARLRVRDPGPFRNERR